jgi:Cu/Ag efflux protein CusF
MQLRAKHPCGLVCAALFTLVMPSFAMAKQEAMKAQRVMSASATITKIDKSQRKLSLRDEEGKVIDVVVDPEVRNFDQLKTGDRVAMRYEESIAISIRKPGEPAQKAGERTQMERAPEGEKPGGTLTQETMMSATVVAVNPRLNNVTLRDQKGNTRTFTVKDPDLQKRLVELRSGQKVDITYTEAVAVSVQPAAPTK